MRQRQVKDSGKMIISIDPDTEASGVAILEAPWRLADVMLSRKSLPELFTWLYEHPAAVVAIEAGWMNAKGLAFIPGRQRAIRVGRNHEIGLQLVKLCERLDRFFLCWRPVGAKWSHEDFVRVTGSPITRTNQEERDAVRCLVMSSGIEISRTL
ncbi:MAG: hypothetical protein ACREVA_00090 [Burkholderiales bacterium]